MNSKRLEWLVDYLINSNFGMISSSEELEKNISGMTAKQIIEAMENAKKIQDSLKATSLGRELN